MKIKKLRGGEIFISPLSLGEKNPGSRLYRFFKSKFTKKYCVMKDMSILKKIGIKKHLKILSVFIISSLPLETSAISQITDPINISNASRGAVYDETVAIINPDNRTAQINLCATGDISGWVKFYETPDSQQTVEKLDFPPNSKKDIIARIAIPTTIPNGNYNGSIRIFSASENLNNNEEPVGPPSEGIDRGVRININGEENISFDASVAAENYDVNRGDPIKIKVIYQNNGDVDISPEIELQIKNSDNKAVYNEKFSYSADTPRIIPNSSAQIPLIKIPTDNFDSGRYKATLKIFQGEKNIEKDFDFSVGTAKTAGAVNSLLGFTDFKTLQTGNIISTATTVLAILFCLFMLIILKSKTKNKL